MQCFSDFLHSLASTLIKLTLKHTHKENKLKKKVFVVVI